MEIIPFSRPCPFVFRVWRFIYLTTPLSLWLIYVSKTSALKLSKKQSRKRHVPVFRTVIDRLHCDATIISSGKHSQSIKLHLVRPEQHARANLFKHFVKKNYIYIFELFIVCYLAAFVYSDTKANLVFWVSEKTLMLRPLPRKGPLFLAVIMLHLRLKTNFSIT